MGRSRTFWRGILLARKPREFARTVAFHVTGQRRVRTKHSWVNRLIWWFFFGTKTAPKFGRYSHFGAGDVELVFENLGLTKRKGWFVEAGAYDGIGSSNSKYLELFCGWRGLLVEPEPESARLASYHRRSPVIQAALVPPNFQSDEVQLEYSGLMTTTDLGTNSDVALQYADAGAQFLRPFEERFRFSAPAVTIGQALESVNAPNEIGLVSLDLEGIELDVLAGFDFQKYDVEYFLIEAREEKETCDFFEQRGYQLKLRVFPVGLLFAKT